MINLSSQNEEVSSSEDDLGFGAAERRCEFQHSALGNCKRQSRPELCSGFGSEESSSNEDADADDVPKKRRRSKVKSGAVIKKRAVVKTELWPHTIANEEDGENISIEDISLSKFFSCFTFIMINCAKPKEVIVEAIGRNRKKSC